MNPENTFFSVKRFIGRKMNEVKDESKQASLRSVLAHVAMQQQHGGDRCTVCVYHASAALPPRLSCFVVRCQRKLSLRHDAAVV